MGKAPVLIKINSNKDRFLLLQSFPVCRALLHRSPKTLSNLFAAYGMPSPLKIIQERVVTEAKRLLLHTSHSIKEISVILGFESVGTFSRFFKNMTGENTSAYRKRLQ